MTDEYVLGTDQAELDRLGLQHRAWRAQAYDHWERAGFAPGDALLDVGAGPGFATLDLARLVGARGNVTAVDMSRSFLGHLKGTLAHDGIANVTLVESDVTKLALEPASHDGAWCRWVFSFVRDPDAMIDGVARALRPGASFAIQEYVSYSSMKLGPSGKAFARLVPAIMESWRAQGGEADVALRLPSLLERHGFVVTDARPIARVARPGSHLWEWPSSFFANYVPKLVAGGFLSADDARAFEEEWRAHASDPDAIFLAPTVLEITASRA